jgi:tetratricopeptide (TPR) repeat protein
MIKSMLVTLPLVLMLLDYWPLQRAQPGKLAGLVIEKLPLLALSAAACVATILAQHEGIQSAGSFSLPLRIGNALVACIIYLRQMVWPAGLAAFYPYPLNGQSAWEVGLAGMLLAGFSAVALNQRRKQPWIFVGWLWYLIMLLPVVGIVQVGDQAHADRYTYLPQIGIYVAVTWWVARLEAGRAAFGVLMASIVGALMFCAWKQTTHWKNNKTLWTHALNCTTRNYVAHFNLGNALRQEGKLDEAMSQYRSALQIRPDYPQAHNNLGKSFLQKGQVDNAITQFQQALQINPGLATAHYNLGAALFEKGKVDEAIAQYQLALQLSPGYAQGHFDLAVAFLQKGRVTEAITENQKGLQIDPGNAEACYNLGLSLRKQGRLDEAVAHYQRALEIRPGYAEARYNLGNVFAQQGRLDEAVAQYQKALELKPDYAEAHYNLGTAFLQQGRLDETIKQYQKALELKPDNAEGHYNLGNLFGQQGRLDEAIRHFQKALALQPDYAEAQNGLGNSFAQQGRMEEAIAHYQKAVELKPDYAEARKNLASILATSPQAAVRNGKKAVELAERANQLTGGGNPLIVCTLAAAYAENGQFSEAVETAQRALSLAGASSNAPLVGQLQYELNLYQAGRPFHIPEQPH